jgi:hypothetical protein
VNLVANKNPLEQLEIETLKTFDIMIMIGCNPIQLKEWNIHCRKAGVLFFAADQFGFHSYLFSDLQSYKFINERKRQGVQGESVTREERIFEYPTLESTWNHEFNMPDSTAKGAKRWFKSVHSLFFAMNALWQFYLCHERYPDMSQEKDHNELLDIRKTYLERIKIDPIVLDPSFLM